MKQRILFFILGIIVTVCLAAASENLYVFKPARPVNVLIMSFGGDGGSSSDTNIKAEQYINKKIGEGYVLSSAESIGNFQVRVVMTKY